MEEKLKASSNQTVKQGLNKNLNLLLDTNTSLDVSNYSKSSDEDISKLLKKMERLLSPNDHSVFDSNGNQSVSDILKAADELVHSSSPLFEALSPSDSHNISNISQQLSSKSFKVDIPQLPLYNNSLSPIQSRPEENKIDKLSKQKSNLPNNSKHRSIDNNLSPQNTSQQSHTEHNMSKQNIDQNHKSKSFDERIISKHRPLNQKVSKETSEHNTPKHNTKDKKNKEIINTNVNKANLTLNINKHKLPEREFTLETNKHKGKKGTSINKAENNISPNKIKKEDNNGEKINSINAKPSEHSFKFQDKINIQSEPHDSIDKTEIHKQFNDTNTSTISKNVLKMNKKDSGQENILMFQSESSTIPSKMPVESSINSVTQTLSTREDFMSETIVSKNEKLKMTDLKCTNSLERELEIQKNKVRQLKEELNSTIRCHLQQLESLKISHEEDLLMMKRQFQVAQETEIKRRILSQQAGIDKALSPLDDQLFNSYDKENRRLCQEIKALKAEFRDAEIKWQEEKSKLILQLDQNENETLWKQLRDARNKIKCLEHTVKSYKSQEASCDSDAQEVINKLEQQNCQLMEEMCELTRRINEGEQADDINELKNALTNQNKNILNKDAEVAKLTEELKYVIASREPVEDSKQFKELKAQLNEGKNLLKTLKEEKEILAKDNYDLRRQVKELEIIVKKRNNTGCLTITGQEFFPETEKIKQLESQLNEKDENNEHLKSKVDSLYKQYDSKIEKLENQLKTEGEKFKLEIEKMKKIKIAHAKELEDVKKAMKKPKEDAHFLATIRGLQSELLNKDKLVTKLGKELDDTKKTNRTLQKEREKILSSKNDSKHSSTSSLKSVGTSDNGNSAELSQLRARVQTLEEDLVTLHEKANYDLNTLKEQHTIELNKARSTKGTTAELEGQIYTQEIIITHLKQKLAQLESLQNSNTLLKLENEKLEKLLTQANSTISKLNEATSNLDPSSSSSQSVLSKMDYLERRHEVREKTLQAIIHELLSDKKTSTSCLGECHSKLVDKNREICYYRAEMDRILDSLRQYKQNSSNN